MIASRMSYEECVRLAALHEGRRVRFTYPNGHQHVGVVSLKWRWPNDPAVLPDGGKSPKDYKDFTTCPESKGEPRG